MVISLISIVTTSVDMDPRSSSLVDHGSKRSKVKSLRPTNNVNNTLDINNSQFIERNRFVASENMQTYHSQSTSTKPRPTKASPISIDMVPMSIYSSTGNKDYVTTLSVANFYTVDDYVRPFQKTN